MDWVWHQSENLPIKWSFAIAWGEVTSLVASQLVEEVEQTSNWALLIITSPVAHVLSVLI